MNKNLYESIINDIAKIVKSELNEMSKNISFRNIDRKVWLSVASTISKNKATDAEFIKPMKKLTLDELLQRYVAALLISKKQCPKTKKDIETLKTYKLYAQKALELGASISDIKELYDQNNNQLKTQVNKVTTPKRTITKSSNTVNTIQKKQRSNKYLDLLESFIVNLPERSWNMIKEISPYYNPSNNAGFKQCKQQLEKYIMEIIRKSHNSIDKFGELIRKDFKQFYKIMNIDSNVYMEISKFIGNTESTFNSFSHYLNISITEESTEIFETYKRNSFSNNNVYKNPYKDDQIFKNLTNYSPKIYVRGKKETLNLLEIFTATIYNNIVYKYIQFKKENRYNNNKQNISSILKKYNMSENGVGTYKWVKDNIYNILYENPDIKIDINYGDWQGSIENIYYDSALKKYFVSVYCQGDSTDWDESDYLSNLLANKDKYKLKSSYQDCMCYISDLDEAFKILYANILTLIKNGKLN